MSNAHNEVSYLEGSIDLLFLDVDPEGYVDRLGKLLPELRVDGLIVTYNVASLASIVFCPGDANPALSRARLVNMEDRRIAITRERREPSISRRYSMLYVVAGATGQVGGHVAASLLDSGHRVRVLVRDSGKGELWRQRGAEVAVASLYDSDALHDAFHAADGIFVLNPPAYASDDILEDARKVCTAVRDAAASADVGRVVGLSSVGAHRESGTGNIGTNYLLERTLGDLACPTAFVRAAWFMENAIGVIPIAREQSIVPSFLMPLDRAIPQVATADIGRIAANLLTDNWTGCRVVELRGPRDYSPLDLASAIGEIISRDVQAVPFPRDAWPAFFAQLGMSDAAGRCWSEMIDGFNSGWITFEGNQETQVGQIELFDALCR